MNNYYVYIYLDPRKSGQYCYSDVCFLYEPFYIGKGKNGRYKESNRNRSKCFKNKLNKIKKLGLKPVVFKLYENLDEIKSFEIEKQLIKEIGRIDLKTGTLINFTNGGEGSSGRIISENTRIKLIKNHADFSGIKNPNFGKHLSIKTKNKISIKIKGRTCSEKTKKLMSEKNRGENNKSSKLVNQDIIQIKLLLKEGKLTQKEIGKKFGVNDRSISNIKTGKKWSHIGINEHV